MYGKAQAETSMCCHCRTKWCREDHFCAPLRLRSTQLALRRIAARVRQGGHNVPRADVIRRFSRGWENFQRVYRPLADNWAVYDNSGDEPKILEKSS
jgi:predicted ABC-type ATPase